MSNYLRCKVFFREKPPEKTDSYSREKERSLGIEKKMIIVYTIIMTVILVIVKKKINTSHNINMNNDNLWMDKFSHSLNVF